MHEVLIKTWIFFHGNYWNLVFEEGFTVRSSDVIWVPTFQSYPRYWFMFWVTFARQKTRKIWNTFWLYLKENEIWWLHRLSEKHSGIFNISPAYSTHFMVVLGRAQNIQSHWLIRSHHQLQSRFGALQLLIFLKIALERGEI